MKRNGTENYPSRPGLFLTLSIVSCTDSLTVSTIRLTFRLRLLWMCDMGMFWSCSRHCIELRTSGVWFCSAGLGANCPARRSCHRHLSVTDVASRLSMQSPQLGHALRSKTAVACAQKPQDPENPKKWHEGDDYWNHWTGQGRRKLRRLDRNVLDSCCGSRRSTASCEPHPTVDCGA